jgi:hypothetical protein
MVAALSTPRKHPLSSMQVLIQLLFPERLFDYSWKLLNYESPLPPGFGRLSKLLHKLRSRFL